MISLIIIGSAISFNQNALFVPCDHILYVHDDSFSVYIAPGRVLADIWKQGVQIEVS